MLIEDPDSCVLDVSFVYSGKGVAMSAFCGGLENFLATTSELAESGAVG